jgi:hypothetical protein
MDALDDTRLRGVQIEVEQTPLPVLAKAKYNVNKKNRP